MRYLFSTGLFGAVTAGISLLRGTREAPVTWRALLAWASWAITLALAVGAAIDMRRDDRGETVAIDSPLAGKQDKRVQKQRKKQLKAVEKAAKAAMR